MSPNDPPGWEENGDFDLKIQGIDEQNEGLWTTQAQVL